MLIKGQPILVATILPQLTLTVALVPDIEFPSSNPTQTGVVLYFSVMDSCFTALHMYVHFRSLSVGQKHVL